jgi:hypothetical protein
MIFFKFITPGNYYSNRKVKVLDQNGVVNFLSSKENLLLHNNEIKNKYQLKLDYHRLTFTTKTNEKNKNVFIIVYFNFRAFLPLFFFDLMFRNSLRIREVSEFEFENANQQNFLINETRFLNIQNQEVKIILSLCITNCIFQLFVLFGTPGNFKSDALLFIGTAISLISLSRIFFTRKKITLHKFLSQIFSYLLFSLILIIESEIYLIQNTIISSLLISVITPQLFRLIYQSK